MWSLAPLIVDQLVMDHNYIDLATDEEWCC